MKDKFEELKEKLEELKVKWSIMDPAVKRVIILSAGSITTRVVIFSIGQVFKSHVALDIDKKVYQDLINGKIDYIRIFDVKTNAVVIMTLGKP